MENINKLLSTLILILVSLTSYSGDPTPFYGNRKFIKLNLSDTTSINGGQIYCDSIQLCNTDTCLWISAFNINNLSDSLLWATNYYVKQIVKDTANVLRNEIELKLNISDTTDKWLPLHGISDNANLFMGNDSNHYYYQLRQDIRDSIIDHPGKIYYAGNGLYLDGDTVKFDGEFDNNNGFEIYTKDYKTIISGSSEEDSSPLIRMFVGNISINFDTISGLSISNIDTSKFNNNSFVSKSWILNNIESNKIDTISLSNRIDNKITYSDTLTKIATISGVNDSIKNALDTLNISINIYKADTVNSIDTGFVTPYMYNYWNSKQSELTNPVTASHTPLPSGYLLTGKGNNTVDSTNIYYDGKNIGFGITTKLSKITVKNNQDITDIGGTTTASSTKSIVGNGTTFLTSLGIGDRISLSSVPTTYVTVTEIADNTHLTVSGNLGNGTLQTINKKSAIFRLDDATGIPLVTVRDNGDFGIGVANPLTPLHVYSYDGILIGHDGIYSRTSPLQMRLFTTSSVPNAGYITFGDGSGYKLCFGRNSDAGTTPFVTFMDNGKTGMGSNVTPTAVLHIGAGTTTIPPLKLTSGQLLSSPQAGSIEFLTDVYYGTITTGATRKTFAFLESPTFIEDISLQSNYGIKFNTQANGYIYSPNNNELRLTSGNTSQYGIISFYTSKGTGSVVSKAIVIDSANNTIITKGFIGVKDEPDSLIATIGYVTQTISDSIKYSEVPYYYSYFNDSSISISLTNDVWTQLTNSTKSLWPDSALIGFTSSGDTVISNIKGILKFTLTISVSKSTGYKYIRLVKKRNSSIIELNKSILSVDGIVNQILFVIDKDTQINDKYYLEYKSTSSGILTLYNGTFIIETIKLNQ